EISQQQFLALWPSTEGRRLEKTRYTMKENGCQLELDVYQGSLTGLVVAEVEFESAEESQRFSPPSWFGKEVTNDKHYKNSNLALERWTASPQLRRLLMVRRKMKQLGKKVDRKLSSGKRKVTTKRSVVATKARRIARTPGKQALQGAKPLKRKTAGAKRTTRSKA